MYLSGFVTMTLCVQAEDENGKTAEQIADDIKEEEMAAFLKACATGKIPAKAPAAKVSLLTKICEVLVKIFRWTKKIYSVAGSRAERVP